MKSIDIPDDIDQLDIALQEKAALVILRQRHRIPNGALAKELGLSDSGVRTMLRRFKQRGLIREFYIEGERQFQVMVDENGIRQPGCQKVTKSGALEIRHKLTATPPAGLMPDERSAWMADYYAQKVLSLQHVMLSMNTSQMCGYFASEFQHTIEQVEAATELLEPIKAHLLTVARYYRNHQVAAGFAVNHLEKEEAVEILKVLQSATPHQLGKLYERIQADKALGNENSAKALLFDSAPSKAALL